MLNPTTRLSGTLKKRTLLLRAFLGLGSTLFMVPKAGLEPAQLAPPPPQGGVSTNFTTSA
jgi:hypothetical protein